MKRFPKGFVRLTKLISVVLGILLTIICQAKNVNDAVRHFEEGDYEDAFEVYERLSLDKPKDLRLRYNAGVAAYRAGEYEKAFDQFDLASVSSDLILQQQSLYNLANTLYRRGEAGAADQKASDWKQAIANYENALRLDSSDDLARENLAFVKKRLEELEDQQKQNEEDQDQESENSEESENSNSSNESDESEESNDSESSNDSDDSEESENSESSNDSDESEESEESENSNSSNESEDSEKSEKSNSSNSEDREGEDSDEGNSPSQKGKMTPEQAEQLLDSERGKAKAMIFRPPKSRSHDRRFKDW